MKTWQLLARGRRRTMVQGKALSGTVHLNEEDLEFAAFDKASPEDRLKIESHLGQCETCRKGFEEARIFADRLQELLQAQGRQDQRKSIRYPVHESAIVTLLHPPEFVSVKGQMMDVSAKGLRVRLPRAMHRGAQLQVQVEKAAVFGTVRYCRTIDEHSYDVGLAIDQIVMHCNTHVEQNPLLSAGDQSDVTTSKGEETDAAANPIEILLIDDNPADVKLVQLMFQEISVPHHLSVALDGAEALQRLFDPAAPSPNMILLDLNLPGLSGLEVLRRLRAERATEALPVAVLSNSTSETDLRRATALGIRAYLHKPENLVHYTDLREKVSALMTEILHYE